MYARYDAGRAGLKGRRVPVANMQHGNRTDSLGCMLYSSNECRRER